MMDTQAPTIGNWFGYPMTSRVNQLGHLEVGGCDIVDLANEFGTPLYVYDEATLRDLCREYMNAFSALIDEATIVYAGKSFLCKAMCELVAQEGLSLDVSSGGELWMAGEAGFPAARICCHGNNKTVAELVLALDMEVGRIIVDSFHEISLLEGLAAERNVRQRVLLRIAPGVVADTHKSMQTGQLDSKFGFPLRDVLDAVRATLACPHIDLVGVHCHIGSQIMDLSPYREAISVLVGLAADWREVFGLECREIDIGGGLAIDYLDGDCAPTIGEFAALVTTIFKSECKRRCLPVPRLLVEPGRSISGTAGLTAYRVGSLKQVPDSPLYVAVDGGMSDNIRPMLYDSRYRALVADRATAEADLEVRVVGKHCESGDILIRATRIATPKSGDTLVTPATGAYAYSLANNYNGQPRSAVVFVRDGIGRIVVSRETWADVARLHRTLDSKAAADDA
jgi:diaminopimelate decarboxylase